MHSLDDYTIAFSDCSTLRDNERTLSDTKRRLLIALTSMPSTNGSCQYLLQANGDRMSSIRGVFSMTQRLSDVIGTSNIT